MQQPLISVICPVGPRHLDHVQVAAASLAWQTVPRAWVEFVPERDTDRSGPAATRNRALARARGLFTVALDADDYLIPSALETYLRAYAVAGASYVYADNYVIGREGWHYSSSEEYSQAKMARYNQHVVTALYPTELLREAGGWDEGVDIWEDWTAPLRFAIKGWCGYRTPHPALVYRITEGERMSRGMAAGEALMVPVWERYADKDGRIVMCGCNQPKAAKEAQQQAQIAVQVLGAAQGFDGLRLEFAGPQRGAFSVTSPHTQRQYKLGGGRMVDAAPEDREWLISLGCAPVARAEFVPPPEPAGIAYGQSEAPAGQPEPAPLSLSEAVAIADHADPGVAAVRLAEGPTPPAEDVPFEPKRMRTRKGAA